MTPGRFIVVEGLEGAGKTTAIETIKHYLHDKVNNVIITREPGGTYIAEKLRALIKETIPNEPLDERSELLMLYAARVQLLEQVIRPALARGDWVIADRFELSTYAYQGGGRGINQTILDTLSAFCLSGLKPDLTIFLDISPELGLKRADNRGKLDRIEQESLAFFNRVYDAYHNKLNNTTGAKLIDASLPLDQVQQAICLHLEAFLNEHA
ncbi:dTMP kinase [Legionella beliardensis]|uniref:Thymidylate kinase n=1 Tax=Legionella beliardensis TaxID=91822 RepID=A0A378I1T5_9GAMM|nr:dTMP kinase [Legionella beliardensis]STX28963.1 dTMP kinase [Legionella beliardensis]